MSQFATVLLNTSTPTIATKSCSNGVNSWSTGVNQLDWTAPPPIVQGYNFGTADHRWMYLQYSAVDNNRPKPSGPSYYHTLLGRTTPEADSFWTTLRTWVTGELPSGGPWPSTFQHAPIQHSTLYYYRLIFISLLENDTPRELDSNVAVIVQPFDLSICAATPCTPDACGTIPQNIQPRLIWDVPMFTIPFISYMRCPCTTPDNVNAAWNRITVNYPYVPTPTSFDVYKSSDGINFTKVVTNAALNQYNEWYDSNPSNTNPAWYYFAANRPNGSVINSTVVKAAY